MAEAKAKTRELTLRRWREVRDVHRKLSMKYKSEKVMEFIQMNYFMRMETVYNVLQACDKEPVENPSITYQNVMRDDFYI